MSKEPYASWACISDAQIGKSEFMTAVIAEIESAEDQQWES